MIEINLVPGKKEFKLPVILGVDLNYFNIKLGMVALAIHMISIPVISDIFNGTLEERKKVDEEKNALYAKAVIEGKSSKDVQEKVEQLNLQEKKLQDKLNVVKQILKIKKNPLAIMLYITKNIPDDIWLSKMEIVNDSLILEGGSSSYKSIGIFIDLLQGAIFFGNTVKLLDSKTSNESKTKQSEQFKIGAQITRYE